MTGVKQLNHLLIEAHPRICVGLGLTRQQESARTCDVLPIGFFSPRACSGSMCTWTWTTLTETNDRGSTIPGAYEIERRFYVRASVQAAQVPSHYTWRGFSTSTAEDGDGEHSGDNGRGGEMIT